MYIISMLKRITVWLDAQHLKKLAAIAKKETPGTKVSMLIRQAIAEFIERKEKEKEKELNPEAVRFDTRTAPPAEHGKGRDYGNKG